MALTLNQNSHQKSPLTHPIRSTAAQQAFDIQRQLAKDALSDVKPLERAAIARAWCDVNEERRKLAMRPLPRPIDTTKFGKGSRSRRPALVPEPVPTPATVE